MKNFLKKNWFKISILFFLFFISISIAYYFVIYLPQRYRYMPEICLETSKNGDQNEDIEVGIFKCPEDYKSQDDYIESLAKSISEFKEKYPDMSTEDYLDKRYDDLITHGCQQALFNMNRINTSDLVIKFNDKVYGPYEEYFYDDTRVANVYYPLKKDTSNSDEGIHLNFYIRDVYSDSYFSAESIARYIDEDSGLNIDYKFQAPDPVNEGPAFFLTGYVLNESDNSGYIHFIKVANVGKHVYSISFTKKIITQSKDKHNEILEWIQENPEALDIGYIGPDETWMDLFIK